MLCARLPCDKRRLRCVLRVCCLRFAIQLVAATHIATGWIVVRVGKELNAYITYVKVGSEIVRALGEKLEVISDALFSDRRIEVCEKVDPAPLEDIGFMVGQARVSFMLKVVAIVIVIDVGSCDCACQTEEGSRTCKDW
mgnify:CR=1 FL=1